MDMFAECCTRVAGVPMAECVSIPILLDEMKDSQSMCAPCWTRNRETRNPLAANASAILALEYTTTAMTSPGSMEAVVLTTFCRNAVQGVPCTFVDEDATPIRLVQGLMRFNRSLTVLTITAPNNAVVCPLNTVLDIFSVALDGRECFDQSLIEALEADKEADPGQLMKVVFYPSDQERACFSLVAKSAEDRETFTTCMAILVEHSRQVVRDIVEATPTTPTFDSPPRKVQISSQLGAFAEPELLPAYA